MKKELKRYMLVEYVGSRETIIETEEDYQVIMYKINRYNASHAKDKQKYMFGNVQREKLTDDRTLVRYHIYHRLGERSTISELDSFTSGMSEEELALCYRDILMTRINEGFIPDINIAYYDDVNKKDKTDYTVDRRIKYIPVLYKDDVCYMNKEYIFKCFAYYLRNEHYGFFLDLANEFECHKDVSEEIERLRVSVNTVKCEGVDPVIIYQAARSLYEALIVERDKTTRVVRDKDGNIQISRRRKRDIGFFVRDYGMKSTKRNSPLKYNKKQVIVVDDEISYDEDDRLQEEYALDMWDQQNGDYREDYEVGYNPVLGRFYKE